MSHVVVVTKPSHAQIILPLLKRMHPGRRIIGVLDGTVSLLTFRYPRGLSMSEYPYVSAPRWQPSSERRKIGHLVYELVDGGCTSLNADPFATVRDAEAVICADGDWYRGCANFDMLLRYSGGDGLADKAHDVVPWMRREEVESLEAERSVRSTLDPDFVRMRDGGLAKRRFDWCFAVNSQTILSKAWRQATGLKDGPVIGKYALQLLYALRGQAPASESAILMRMHDWKGTGRYQQCDRSWGMGSAISASMILDDLKKGLLIEPCDMEGHRATHYAISDAGMRMLDLLHRGCRDADLPFRVATWQEQGRDAHHAVDRYIRTFFGRQKRFMHS